MQYTNYKLEKNNDERRAVCRCLTSDEITRFAVNAPPVTPSDE